MRAYRTVAGLLCALGSLGSGTALAAPSSRLESFTLENGLVVLVRKVTSAKDATVAVVYRVGNQHDPEGRSGMAGLIAQLYHAAATEVTPSRPPDSLLPRIPQGSHHAVGWTALAADDHTLLARTLPSQEVAQEVQDAADRMAGLKVGEEDLARAREGLRRRIENVEEGRLPIETARWRARERIVPLPHGGRRPGRSSEVLDVGLDEVRARLARLYVPANAIVSVVGDVDVGALRQQAKKRLGSIPRGEPISKADAPAGAAVAPSEQQGPELIECAAASKQAGAALAIRAPDPAPTQAYASHLVLTARLFDAWHAASAQGGVGAAEAIAVTVDLLGDAECLCLTWRAPADTDPTAADARLRGTLSAALAKPVATADLVRVRTLYNMHFGAPPIEGSWGDDPLVVAHADARRTQLGLDGDAVLRLLSSVTLKDLKEVAGRASAVVVARPTK